MDLESLFPLLMFVVLFLGVLTGFPVAFVLGITGALFGIVGYHLELFLLSDFGFIAPKVFGVMSNMTLLAVPLFVFMGVTLERTGVAEDLLNTSERLCSQLRGGLTLSLVLVGALLAASTGIVGATVVTMGVLSLPTLLKRKYDIALSCGTIAASGTLGQIIPPSIVLVLLADMMNIAVADLFAACVVPGCILVASYLGYILVRTQLQPSLSPLSEVTTERISLSLLLRSFLPPITLMLLVLGSILLGIASPTESAGCGAAGALLLGLLRRSINWKSLFAISQSTLSITAMVFMLLIGAQVFSVVFRGLYGDDVIIDLITSLELTPSLVLLVVMLLLFGLGFFLDFIEICFIAIPVVTPILVGELEMNPLWLAVLIAINLQTSFLTPPFGFALFYLRGVAPPEVKTWDIYRGAAPYVGLQIAVLLLLWFFPELTLWLPNTLFDT